MSSIASAAPAVTVTAPTLGSASTSHTDASSASPAPFSQAMSEAEAPAAHGSAAPHRPRSTPGGSAVPPHGNTLPPATVAAPAPAPAPSLIAPLVATGLAKLDASLAAAGIDPAVAAATPDTAPGATLAHAPVPAARTTDAAPGLGTAAGDGAAAGEVSATGGNIAETASTAPPVDPAPGAAASAAADAAAAAVLDRSAALSTAATPGGGKTGSMAPANAPGGAAAPAIDADRQSAGATTIASPVLPVFALQAGLSRQGDASTGAAHAAPVGDTSAGAAAGAAGLNSIAAAQSAAAPSGVAPPPPQPASPQFPEQLAAHVSYLVDSNLNGATLQVSPPQLGPIELRVSVDAGHAQVWLSAHSAATVDALQQSSSKLRDMLASQGFGQVSVDISQRSFHDRSQGAQPYVWGGTDEPRVQATGTVIQGPLLRASSGVLDAYA